MSARRVLVGSAIALLMPASLLLSMNTSSATSTTTADSTSVAATAAARKQGKQRVKIQSLPQIMQQGRSVASPNAARAAIVATIKPKRVGRLVKLQVQRGSRWTTVSKTRQNDRGRAVFGADVSRRGLPLTYRVQAKRYKGLKAVTSGTTSTERWLSPTWSDDFSGRKLSAYWNYRGQTYEKASLRQCSKGDPKAVKVRGGKVRISVIKDPKRKNQKCKARKRGKVAGKYAYRLNGHIGTQGAFDFQYGVAAARVKFHKQRGQHASFWMQPADGGGPGSDGSEIDVIEYFGDKHPNGGLTTFIHWYKGNKSIKTGSWIKKSDKFLKNKRDSWSKNYHVFSVEWTPSKLIFRIDGKESWRTNKGVSQTPQYPILSLLASDYEIPLMKDKQLPQHMDVDWIRVWETTPTP